MFHWLLMLRLELDGCKFDRHLNMSKKFILAKAGSASKPLKLKLRFTLNLNFLTEKILDYDLARMQTHVAMKVFF